MKGIGAARLGVMDAGTLGAGSGAPGGGEAAARRRHLPHSASKSPPSARLPLFEALGLEELLEARSREALQVDPLLFLAIVV